MTQRYKRLMARSEWEPTGMSPLSKFVVPAKKIDEAKRQITFTISTAGRDRDGDIIEQAGWLLGEYQKNPVVLWAHDGRQPPIARAESVAVEGGRLVSVARFAKREEYEFADTIYRLYVGGFLNATSVGFEPEDLELIEGDEPGMIGFRFLRQKLLEYSAVPIPSNPEALVVARGAGIDVGPCEDWIEQLLDEKKGGSLEGLLNRSYIALKGRLHSVQQAGIASKNAAALTDEPEKAPGDDDDDRPTLTTSSGGEAAHSHTFKAGDPQTDPGGEDGHVHAITYAEGGDVTIEGAEGHSHDAPAGAAMPGEDEDADKSAADAAPEAEPDPAAVALPEPEAAPVEAAPAPAVDPTREFFPEYKVTDWPQPGMMMPVSLLTSEYRTFPVAEMAVLKDEWPEIWGLGYGPPEDGTDEDMIRAREAWAAKHVDDYELADVVSQVHHLVRGSRGIEYMRLMLSKAKEHVQNERDKAKGLTPEQIEAITDRVVQAGVVPAIEKAFRKYTGRLS